MEHIQPHIHSLSISTVTCYFLLKLEPNKKKQKQKLNIRNSSEEKDN
uniref:Uncharacterized protein n=1 Tax=Anguilla anguilla TaxID=7936 RepID=A0A0E9U9B1_ANGAN